MFWSQIPAGNTTPYSFAVFGDWGDTDVNGNNPAQAAIMSSIANSGVRFALGTGDTGYDGGTQGNYGDLYQTGYRVSSIFGPNYWAQAGDTVPFFNAVGNHGANATYFNNWPQDRVVANSGGKYAMETYCCANGANSQKSPSSWYAFDAGVARVYVLSAVWSDSNTGTSTDYGMDYAYRWQQNSAEYQWLQNDLQTHPSQLKFAVFHYPLYSDNATEPSDTFLQGSNSLEGLLESNGVNMVFNGHAHLYQHNAAPPGGVVSYTSGGGGATPEPITKCKPQRHLRVGMEPDVRWVQLRCRAEAHADRAGVPLPQGRCERLSGDRVGRERARADVRHHDVQLLPRHHAADRAGQPAGERAVGHPRGSHVDGLDRREGRHGLRRLP